MKKVLLKIWDNLEGWICILIMVVMVFILFQQVVLRYVFSNSNAWSEELARYLHIYLIFISCSLAMKKDTHIKIDIMLRVWPKKLRPYAALLGEFITITFFILTIYYSIVLTQKVFSMGQLSQSMLIPLGYIYMAIPIGYSLMTVRLIANLVRKFKGRKQQAAVSGEEK